jgi:hypothetical protein
MATKGCYACMRDAAYAHISHDARPVNEISITRYITCRMQVVPKLLLLLTMSDQKHCCDANMRCGQVRADDSVCTCLVRRLACVMTQIEHTLIEICQLASTLA